MNKDQHKTLVRLQQLERTRKERILTYDENQEYRLKAATVAPFLLRLLNKTEEPQLSEHKDRDELKREVRVLKQKLRAARIRAADLEYKLKFLTPMPSVVLIESEDGTPVEWRSSDGKRYQVVHCFADT